MSFKRQRRTKAKHGFKPRHKMAQSGGKNRGLARVMRKRVIFPEVHAKPEGLSELLGNHKASEKYDDLELLVD
jgi:hypothetical protein